MMGQRVPVTAQHSTGAGTRQIPNIWRQNRRVRSVRGRRWAIAGLILVQRPRRWSSINGAMGHRSWSQGCTYPSITGRPAGSANESGCRRAGSVPAIHRAGLSPALQLARVEGGGLGKEGRGGYKTTCRTTSCIQCVKPDVKRSTCSPCTVTYNTPVCVLYYSICETKVVLSSSTWTYQYFCTSSSTQCQDFLVYCLLLWAYLPACTVYHHHLLDHHHLSSRGHSLNPSPWNPKSTLPRWRQPSDYRFVIFLILFRLIQPNSHTLYRWIVNCLS